MSYNPNWIEVTIPDTGWKHNGVKYEPGSNHFFPPEVARLCLGTRETCCPAPGCCYAAAIAGAIEPPKGEMYKITVPAKGEFKLPIADLQKEGCPPPGSIQFIYCADCVEVFYGTVESPCVINAAPVVLDGTAGEPFPICRKLEIDGCPVDEIGFLNCDGQDAKVFFKIGC